MEIITQIVQSLKNRYPDNLIAIYGVGSHFDDTLPADWSKKDLDLIVILKDITQAPKPDWTEIRFERQEMDGNKIWIGYNSLQGLKNRQIFRNESFSNYEWSILDLKVPHNSRLIFGKDIRSQLPDPSTLKYDFDDILRRGLYHLDKSYKVEVQDQNKFASKMEFTKAVFKFCFYLCLYLDNSFQTTSILEISKKTQRLVRENQIESQIMEILKESIGYRRKSQFGQPFHPLRVKFTKFIFSLLGKGQLHQKMKYKELVKFLQYSYDGFEYLIRFANKLKSKYSESAESSSKKDVISLEDDEDLKHIGKKVRRAFLNKQSHIQINSIKLPIKQLDNNKRYVDILEYRYIEQNLPKLHIYKNNTPYAKLIKNKFQKI